MKEKYDVKLQGKEWKDCLKQAFDKKKKDIKMDGFRKGQVPYDVYVKKMGVEALYMDAVDIAVDVLYARLLKDDKTIIPINKINEFKRLEESNFDKTELIKEIENNFKVTLTKDYI